MTVGALVNYAQLIEDGEPARADPALELAAALAGEHGPRRSDGSTTGRIGSGESRNGSVR